MFFVLSVLFSFAISVGASADLQTEITQEMRRRYPGFDVELALGARPSGAGAPHSLIRRVVLFGERRPGEMAAKFERDDGSEETVEFSFRLYRDAWVATRRVQPGTALDESAFQKQRVDVTAGASGEIRGLILPVSERLLGLEARHTIIEGQPLLSTAVQRIPLVRKGQMVRMKILSGGVSLFTQGIVEEPGHLNDVLRVTSMKTKRTLSGRLSAADEIEVSL